MKFNNEQLTQLIKKDDLNAFLAYLKDNNIDYNQLDDDGWSFPLTVVDIQEENSKILEYLLNQENTTFSFFDSPKYQEGLLNFILEKKNYNALEVYFKKLSSIDEISKIKKEQIILTTINEIFKQNDLFIENNLLNKLNNVLTDELKVTEDYFNSYDFIKSILLSDIETSKKDEFLLEKFQKIDLKNKALVAEFDGEKYNNNLGFLAIYANCKNSVDYLIENEFEFSSFNDFEYLQDVAIDNNSFKSLISLLEAGLTLNVKQTKKTINYLAKNYDYELLEQLRSDRYFTIAANKNNEDNLFLLAIRNYNKDLIKWCLENNANIHAKDDKNENAVYLAVERENPELLKYLVKEGVKLDIQDNYGNTPIILAVSQNDIELVKALTDGKTANQVGVNIRNHNGHDAISLAISLQNFDILEKLFFLCPTLSLDALKELRASQTTINEDINGFDGNAIEDSRFKVQGLLDLEALGFNFNVTNENGRTILMEYVKNNKSIVDILNLLDTYCDISIVDKDGFDAVDYAIKNQSNDVLNIILLKRNYDWNIEKTLPLINQAQNKIEMFKVIVKDKYSQKQDIFEIGLEELITSGVKLNDLFTEKELIDLLNPNQTSKLLSICVDKEQSENFHILWNNIKDHKDIQDIFKEKIKLSSNQSFKNDLSDLYNFNEEETPIKKIKKSLK